MIEEFKRLPNCLVCGSKNIVEHCDLGMQPLVNNLKDSPQEAEKKFPILVNQCVDCSHKQLSIAVDPMILFSKYLYRTGVSKSHMDFFGSFVHSLGTDRRVLDIGCNDGSLLSIFKEYDWECTGVEPAHSLASHVADMGIEVFNEFFPTPYLKDRKFDVITAFNVFAHNNNPSVFLKGMSELLSEDGRIYILTTRDAVDSFYHEHVSYFTPRSMMILAENCGLEMKSFKEVSMHGNSYLFEIAKSTKPSFTLAPIMVWPVVAYGASANGIVIMNTIDFRPDYVIDDNPLKQGKYVPGVNVPIFGNGHLCRDKRDLFIVVLAHHLFDEIVLKIKKLRPNSKDKFIHPLKGIL